MTESQIVQAIKGAYLSVYDESGGRAATEQVLPLLGWLAPVRTAGADHTAVLIKISTYNSSAERVIDAYYRGDLTTMLNEFREAAAAAEDLEQSVAALPDVRDEFAMIKLYLENAALRIRQYLSAAAQPPAPDQAAAAPADTSTDVTDTGDATETGWAVDAEQAAEWAGEWAQDGEPGPDTSPWDDPVDDEQSDLRPDPQNNQQDDPQPDPTLDPRDKGKERDKVGPAVTGPITVSFRIPREPVQKVHYGTVAELVEALAGAGLGDVVGRTGSGLDPELLRRVEGGGPVSTTANGGFLSWRASHNAAARRFEVHAELDDGAVRAWNDRVLRGMTGDGDTCGYFTVGNRVVLHADPGTLDVDLRLMHAAVNLAGATRFTGADAEPDGTVRRERHLGANKDVFRITLDYDRGDGFALVSATVKLSYPKHRVRQVAAEPLDAAGPLEQSAFLDPANPWHLVLPQEIGRRLGGDLLGSVTTFNHAVDNRPDERKTQQSYLHEIAGMVPGTWPSAPAFRAAIGVLLGRLAEDIERGEPDRAPDEATMLMISLPGDEVFRVSKWPTFDEVRKYFQGKRLNALLDSADLLAQLAGVDRHHREPRDTVLGQLTVTVSWSSEEKCRMILVRLAESVHDTSVAQFQRLIGTGQDVHFLTYRGHTVLFAESANFAAHPDLVRKLVLATSCSQGTITLPKRRFGTGALTAHYTTMALATDHAGLAAFVRDRCGRKDKLLAVS